jgi:ribosomal protein L37AE/L43A
MPDQPASKLGHPRDVTTLPSLIVDRQVMRPPDERMVCERCGGANVYRMHAVWRCADCGFKTDCCGW